MISKRVFLQGSFPFEGTGLDKPTLIDAALTYTVPAGVTAQPLYFRGGNSTDELITVILMRDGAPMRYFPIGLAPGPTSRWRWSKTSRTTPRWSCTWALPAGSPAPSWSISASWRSEPCPLT